MDHDIRGLAERLLQKGYDDLPEREQRVLRRMAKRIAITQNVNEKFRQELTFGQRLADKVAAFGGSWSFIIIFMVCLISWVMLNTIQLGQWHNFDPYPFIFLNLILSMIAAIQAPVIMMSQNRQTAKDRLAASNDYEVNLKSELEIMSLHEKLDDIRMHHLETLLKQQDAQFAQLQEMIRERDGK